MTSLPLPAQGERKARAKHKETWSDPSTEKLGLIGHGAILSDTKGDTCPKGHQNEAKTTCMCGLRTIPSETGETGEQSKLCMLQRFKSQRGMCEPCARSLKVSGILAGRECRLDVL